VQLVQEAEEFAEKMARFHLNAKEDAKVAKENYEAALDGIRRLIRERHYGMDELKRGQKMLPFAAAPEADLKAEINATFRVEPPAREHDAETRAVRLRDLEIADHTADLLMTAGLETLGHLSDWSGPDRDLASIPGITKAKAKSVDEAVEAFWADRDLDAAFEAAPDRHPEPTGIPQAPGTPLTPPPAKRRTKANAEANPS
jgi:hypothetical protein